MNGGGMKKLALLVPLVFCVFSAPVQANLCDGALVASAESTRDAGFYQQLFPDKTYQGNSAWNAIVLRCNRVRDTKGNEVAGVTAVAGGNAGKSQLQAASLEPKVIRGVYEFLGHVPIISGALHGAAGYKYVYVLSKDKGVWTMIIPYSAIINEIVPNRVDFLVGTREIDHRAGTVSPLKQRGNGWHVYDPSQAIASKSSSTGFVLKPGASPIAATPLCSNTTFFAGQADKYKGESGATAYKRDPENKFVSLGKIQYAYHKDDPGLWEGCRVDEGQDLFWERDPLNKPGEVEKTRPQKYVLDNFVQTAESFWSIRGVFQLKLLLKGHNESAFPKATLDLLRAEDRLTVYFATRFPANGFNQMYKSNPLQFNNFSTMTEDETYHHGVGHAFGLDDEYALHNGDTAKDGCENPTFKALSSTDYVMCVTSATAPRTIFHYLAVSRYVTKQSECDSDSDCGAGRYCDAGLDLTKNQCVALKADDAPCALAGGGHQCQSGHCSLGRCYTPGSVAMGGACFFDDACKVGKCSSVDGTKGTCVCNNDSDCGMNMWCDGGLDLKINACRVKLAKGASCGKAGSIGN